MKVLIIGSGGREHALAWKIASSPSVNIVYVAPGNYGTSQEKKITNINLTKHEDLMDFCIKEKIDYTVVGPEGPLANGIVDDFTKKGLKIFGPTKHLAKLESSKSFAKGFMKKYNIPTAKYEVFTDVELAKNYIEKNNKYPIVIKADGLASGKGVFIAEKEEEALNIINNLLINHQLADSGKKIVIEDFLEGLEASFIVMVDGNNILTMATSQDHKRLLDGDLGPNTGGMGAYSPTPIVTDEVDKKIMDRIVLPTINSLKKEGHSYVGFLYVGLMIDKNSNPYVIEFNCRFGDPETQPIMCRLESDFNELILKALNGKLSTVKAKWNPNYAIGVVLASKGYPDNIKKGDIISGLNDVGNNVKIFYAGAKKENNNIITSGGRVMCLVGLGIDIEEAKKITYDEIKKINFEGLQYRKDIGNKIIEK